MKALPEFTASKVPLKIRVATRKFFYRGTWLSLAAFLVFCSYVGSQKELAGAAATSNTSTITITATVAPTIALYVSATAVDLGTVTAGTDVYGTAALTVVTNCQDGYKLYAYYIKDLQHTVVTTTYIPTAGLGTAAAPSPYTGTGLGFSLSAVANVIQAKWNAAAGSLAANYSSFTSGTAGIEVNNYANYSSGNTVFTIRFQLDVLATQYTGAYTTDTKWYAVTNS